MKKEYPIKETVTVLVVTKQLQKISFQIKHPDNVAEIISIGITCDLVPDVSSGGSTGGISSGGSTGGGTTTGDGSGGSSSSGSSSASSSGTGGTTSGGSTGDGTTNTSTLAGYINIAAPQKGDVIFSSDVRLDNNDFTDLFDHIVSGTSTNFSNRKKYSAYFDTCVKVNNPLFEGFYEDVYSPSLTDSLGAAKPFLYRVRVYIRYRINQEEQKEKQHDC